MTDVTKILSQIEHGDHQATEQLFPLVYDELRKLAAAKLMNEKPGQTLQATALAHEAYLRLLGPGGRSLAWESRGHFFAAASEAMRRILVEAARRKNREKHGGNLERAPIDPELLVGAELSDPLLVLAVHEAVDRLANKSPRKAELVKLRYFLGFTIPEAAEILGIAPATAEEDWTYARAWLRREWLRGDRADAKEKS